MLNWRSQRVRAWIYQIALIGMLIVLVGWLLHNTLGNMRMRGIQSGFDFLLDPAGFDIGESLIPYERSSTYARAFMVGLLNRGWMRVSSTCVAPASRADCQAASSTGNGSGTARLPASKAT